MLTALTVSRAKEAGKLGDFGAPYLVIEPGRARRGDHVPLSRWPAAEDGAWYFPIVSLADARTHRDEARRLIREGHKKRADSARTQAVTFGVFADALINAR